jgi:hypothetical protein
MAFIGFEQFSASTVSEENKMVEPIYSYGDPDLTVLSKKLAKKDATTKLKGIIEFQSLIASKDANIIRKFIPHWVHVYSKLCYDRDHRVRDSLNSSHLVSFFSTLLALLQEPLLILLQTFFFFSSFFFLIELNMKI